MTKEELDFIGSMNMCDEISNDAYKKIACHVEETIVSEDCVSRQAVLNTLFYKSDNNCEVVLNKELQDRIKALPPVTPTHGTCKDCKQLGVMDCGYYCKLNHWGKISKEGNYGGMGDFYCADFEKRGTENDR